jgi:hypothetical protein
MIKKITILLTCFSSISCFAISSCPPAASTASPGFCTSFAKSAICYCTLTGLPGGMCSNLGILYGRMIGMFGSLANACAHQHDTTQQNCIDSWNCYRYGGTNSQGQLCSSLGKAC